MPPNVQYKPNSIVETRNIQWLNKMYFFYDINRSDLPEIRLIQSQRIIAENQIDLKKGDKNLPLKMHWKEFYKKILNWKLGREKNGQTKNIAMALSNPST